MGLEFMTDRDLEKITEAAIRLDEEGVKPNKGVIEAIADGDEDIPVIIRNFAEMRGMLWTTLEGGIRFLEIERELDEERFSTNVQEEKADPDPFRSVSSG